MPRRPGSLPAATATSRAAATTPKQASDESSIRISRAEWEIAKSAGLLWTIYGGSRPITKTCDLAVFRCAAAGKLGAILTDVQMAALKAVWAVEVPNMPDKEAGRQISRACGRAQGFKRVKGLLMMRTHVASPANTRTGRDRPRRPSTGAGWNPLSAARKSDPF